MYFCRYEPCQKHRLGTVSNWQLLVGLNQFYERSTLTLASGMIHRHYSEYAQTVWPCCNKYWIQAFNSGPMIRIYVQLILDTL